MQGNEEIVSWKVWFTRHQLKNLIDPLQHMADEGWNPTEADRTPAWTLYNELRTRVTQEPLRYRDGDEISALTSLHSLFDTTREIMDKHGHEARHFAILATSMLNDFLRRFTTRWHRLRLQEKLSHQDHKRGFRRELIDLQKNLSSFVKVFGLIAEKSAFIAPSEEIEKKSEFAAQTILPTSFLGPQVDCQTSESTDAVLRLEQDAIAERRKAAYGDSSSQRDYGGLGQGEAKDGKKTSKSMGYFGLALSGGGIRSSTFALGALQCFAEKRILRDFDYLSTVSGGGYTGAFLTSHLVPDPDTPQPECAGQVKELGTGINDLLVAEAPDVETAFTRKIRNSSKYLLGEGWLSNLAIGGRWLKRVVFSRAVFLAFPLIAIGFSFPDLFPWAKEVLWSLAALTFVILADVNSLPVHRWYRRQLRQTYIKPTKEGSAPKLSELTTAKQAPYHLICSAVNLPSSKNRELRGRRSDFFVFSPLFCGSVLTGYRATKHLEAAHPDLDLATAVAVSGAAVSSHSGTLKNRWYARPLLMLLGLGYWMPNPRYVDKATRWFPPGLYHWTLEVFGRFSEKRRYINLSDGGHIENLGVYELLRRRCKFIVCIDGECDPTVACSGLIKACRFASIDLGIEIDIDLSELLAGKDGLSEAHFAMGKIKYLCDGPPEIGYLLYLKLSMTGNEKNYIHEYRSRNRSFPHETTADQFFNEDQFEAYRALGYHAAEDLFEKDLFGEKQLKEFKGAKHKSGVWLRALVNALEP